MHCNNYNWATCVLHAITSPASCHCLCKQPDVMHLAVPSPAVGHREKRPKAAVAALAGIKKRHGPFGGHLNELSPLRRYSSAVARNGWCSVVQQVSKLIKTAGGLLSVAV